MEGISEITGVWSVQLFALISFVVCQKMRQKLYVTRMIQMLNVHVIQFVIHVLQVPLQTANPVETEVFLTKKKPNAKLVTQGA
jgi:hypothetical protein